MAKLIQPEQIQLSNGIPVILQQYDGPAASTYWWVRTGSVDEAPKEAGFAHFLEHMLFKDASAKESGRASTGQLAGMIESLGGDINAYTSFDQTVYHVTCAARHWEKVLDAFGRMAKPQKFLAADFMREREVILEELRKNEDSPSRQLFQSLFSTTFGKHPYGRPVIGFEKILKEAKLRDLESFYNHNYVSEKMGLILVGPIEDAKGARKKAIIRSLEKRFGKGIIPRKKAVERPRTQIQGLAAKSQWKNKPFDVKSPTLIFSFRVPELGHEDLPALDLLASVLSMGELSRLYQQLFNQKSIVTDVSGGVYVPNDPGMFYIQMETDSVDRLEAAAAEAFSVIKKLVEEGPTAEELARVMVNSESERLYATQTADGMAGRLGFLKFIIGDLNYDQEYIEQLRSTTTDKIKEVAKKYLDFRRMSGVILVPKENADYDFSGIERLANATFNPGEEISQEAAPKMRAVPRQKNKDKYPLALTFPSGLEVRFCERPTSHVMSIHASVLAGVRLEVSNPIESAAMDWGSS
ncbi:MAG: pitrilysin family protein, partial [Bdellovibrionia bacterium]